MIDAFDIFAFVAFAMLILAVAGIVVGLGSLPGWIVNQSATGCSGQHRQLDRDCDVRDLWPLVLIWAFMKSPESAKPIPEACNDFAKMQTRMVAMETALRELKDGKVQS